MGHKKPGYMLEIASVVRLFGRAVEQHKGYKHPDYRLFGWVVAPYMVLPVVLEMAILLALLALNIYQNMVPVVLYMKVLAATDVGMVDYSCNNYNNCNAD